MHATFLRNQCSLGIGNSFRSTPLIKFRSDARGRALHVLQGPVELLNGRSTGVHDVCRYPGEYSFNLAEYMVVLEKPIGLSLSPDPSTGQIVVQKIADGTSAEACKLIQVGDILKKCGDISGGDMLACTDLKATERVIRTRLKHGKVKLVLERRKRGSQTVWCWAGKAGMASGTVETLQLPVQLDKSFSQVDAAVNGKCMTAGFHRHTEQFSQAPPRQTGAEARRMRARELREQLLSTRDNPAIDLNSPKRARASLTSLETLAQPFVNAAWFVGGRRFAVNQKKVIAVLPWLLVATKRLSTKDLTLLASQQALSCVMELALQMQGGVMGLRGATPSSCTSTSDHAALRYLVDTAAALNRLTYRRHSYLENQQWRPSSCTVLIHCDENMEGEVAKLIACWLHWYGGLEVGESVRAAQDAMGTRVHKSVVEDSTELLVELGKERASQVLLTWPYGGLAADVCGELVGGWDVRVPLKRWVADFKPGTRPMPGQFFLELKGLKPGCYHYKYIVDGTWTVDHYAPKALDASGNWNNCLCVAAQPPVETQEDRLHLARLEAAHQSFQTKLGLPSRN